MLFAILASPILITLFTAFIALLAPPEAMNHGPLLEFFQEPLSEHNFTKPTIAPAITATNPGLVSCPTSFPMELGLLETKTSHPRQNTPLAITLCDFEAPDPIADYKTMPSILDLATIAKTETPSGITSPAATPTSSGKTGAEELHTQLWTGPSEDELFSKKPMVVAVNAPIGLLQELEQRLARARAEEEFWSIKTIAKVIQLFLLRIRTYFSEFHAKRTTILTTLMVHTKVYGPPMKYKAQNTRRRGKIMRIDQPRK
ncbi:hypothetical protein JA9_003956 [Meyerozyma sp. JA9]|nr:hypothetical protein JA9_003956 [Meyerozyma sp. JA9]